MELVVGNDDDRHRRVPKIVRKIEHKTIVVYKDRIQILVKKLPRHCPFKFIKSQIQELERGKPQNHRGELPGEPIVTEIQFKQEFQSIKLVRNSTTKPVGVDVEESKIREQSKLFRQVPSNVTVVEINASDSTNLRVIQCRSTENITVVTHIWSNPIERAIIRIRKNRLLPSS